MFFFPVNVNTRYLSLVIKLYLHFSFSGVIRKRYVRWLFIVTTLCLHPLVMTGRLSFVMGESLSKLHSPRLHYKGDGYILSVQYDWLMVALSTIDQSQISHVHPNDARNDCTKSLYPFSLEFLKWRIVFCQGSVSTPFPLLPKSRGSHP